MRNSNRPLLGPLSGVDGVGRHHEHFTFADRYIEDLAVLGDLQHHVALDLEEPFLDRVVMEIDSGVGAANHHHDHSRVVMQQLIVDGRLQPVLVVFDPLLEVEGGEGWMEFAHGDPSSLSRRSEVLPAHSFGAKPARLLREASRPQCGSDPSCERIGRRGD